jgi:Cu/Ag efflux protein CusF
MRKKLIRCVMAVCIATVALTAAQAVQAATEKTGKKESFSGKIESTDVSGATITIKHKQETKTFAVAPDCTFHGAKNGKITLADLKVGDQVRVVYTQEGGKLVAHHIGHVDLKAKGTAAASEK